MKCEQWTGPGRTGTQCQHEAVVAIMWPGKDLQGLCSMHYAKAASIANALGFSLWPIDIIHREEQEAAITREKLEKL